MHEVRMDKTALRSVVQNNRDAHRAVFEQAIEKYRSAVIAALDERLKDAKAGRQVDLRIALVQPLDHTDDYDRILLMLEMSVDDTIVLGEQEFAWYVQDEWGWKQQWTTTNASYGVRS